MTQKTLTTILDEHRQRAEQVGALIFDAREIVRKRLKPGPSEDRELFDMLHKLHHIHGGNTVEIDARPIADALDFLNANTCLELDRTEYDGWPDVCEWRVRACHGGRNDREWTTIAVADTVETALIKTCKIGKV